jgi:SAM-dependent methyltransferase
MRALKKTQRTQWLHSFANASSVAETLLHRAQTAHKLVPHDQVTPSIWIERFAPLVAPGASLLDVACGYGRHAKFFAARGVRVTAVDRDQAALATLSGIANIDIECRDIEGGEASPDAWPYARECFDAIVVCNYLWRPTFGRMLDSIKPDGVLLYETFMLGNERYGKPSRAEFLLRSNELLERTRDAFRAIAFEEGDVFSHEGKAIATMQRLCARKISVA